MPLAPESRASWVAGMEAVQEQAAGALEIEVIRPVDAVDILGAALTGDPNAARTMQMLVDTAKRIEAASHTRKPMLCGSCPRPLLDNKFSFVLAYPARTDPINAVALAICRKCGTTREGIQQKAVTALRRIWPDLRPITVTNPEGGRA